MKEAQLKLLLRRNERYLNDSNKWVILHSRSNEDLQIIVGPFGIASYCCLYSSKAEAPDQQLISKKVLEMLAKESDLGVFEITRKKLFRTAQAIYASREVCMQEICWFLLGYNFVDKSRKVIDINLTPPSRIRPRLKIGSALEEVDDESDDVLLNGEKVRLPTEVYDYMALDTSAPEKLNDLSLYKFISCYNRYQGKKRSNCILSRKR